MLRITLAVLHLLALSFGISAVVDRGMALLETSTEASMRRIFRSDI
jgi:hypothetical protein